MKDQKEYNHSEAMRDLKKMTDTKYPVSQNSPMGFPTLPKRMDYKGKK